MPMTELLQCQAHTLDITLDMADLVALLGAVVRGPFKSLSKRFRDTKKQHQPPRTAAPASQIVVIVPMQCAASLRLN